MKNFLMIGAVAALFIFGAAVFNSQKQKPTNSTEISIPSTSTSPTTAIFQASEVPLTQETDIIRTFFNLIDEGKASDAVMMMSKSTTSDDSTKQAYGVQYAAMNSLQVSKLEESSKADWSETWHQYMATLDVQMDPSSANSPIPYYGYENGENIRFINLIQEEGKWKIKELATGP
jgi:hypothetical protein